MWNQNHYWFSKLDFLLSSVMVILSPVSPGPSFLWRRCTFVLSLDENSGMALNIEIWPLLSMCFKKHFDSSLKFDFFLVWYHFNFVLWWPMRFKSCLISLYLFGFIYLFLYLFIYLFKFIRFYILYNYFSLLFSM